MAIRKNNKKSKRSKKIFKKTRSKKRRGGTNPNNNTTLKIKLGSASFTPYKRRTPPDYTKFGALPGTKAYREQTLKRRQKTEKKNS